ncbi:unnamed protein product [Dovyalis caffra]|uniref:Uncharacterized protein n=1 Tax=Dovyalis caffra TaxID=77055 RepID=A0AAV1RK82_9ROSI|nr:unnamed protein product [Dovyalis caffra]
MKTGPAKINYNSKPPNSGYKGKERPTTVLLDLRRLTGQEELCHGEAISVPEPNTWSVSHIHESLSLDAIKPNNFLAEKMTSCRQYH